MHTSTKLQHSKQVFLGLFLSMGLFFLSLSQSYAAVVELVALNEPQEQGVFPVFVFVDSESIPTIGTDLLISYNPEKVAFSEVQMQGLYPEEHDVLHDIAKHTIRFSGTYDYQQYEAVQGTLAVVYFESLTEAVNETFLTAPDAPISLVWSKEATNDTNVVSVDGADLVVAAPPSLQIKPEYSTGEVQGLFNEEQKALLAENGVILQASEVDDGIHPLLVFAAIVVFGFLIFLFFIFTKKKKNDEEDELADQ